MKKIKFPKGKKRLWEISLFPSRAGQAASAFPGGSTFSPKSLVPAAERNGPFSTNNKLYKKVTGRLKPSATIYYKKQI
jgi:hypothetical protein